MAAKLTLPALKDYSQKLLRRAGIYERVKASWIYDLYWSVADQRIMDDRRREMDFYRCLLSGFHKGGLIFDVGANEGYKTDIFLRLGAKVVAVEPDEASQGVLKEKFVKYRLKRKAVAIVGKAVSDTGAVERMWIDTPGSAKNTLSQKWADTLRGDDKRFGQRFNVGEWKDVATVSMEQLITAHGVPFFVKIDVEGHELNVLRGFDRPVRFISFEVNLPEFRPEGLECVRVLARLAKEGKFNYTPDCRRGLVLADWVGPEEFSGVLNRCTDPSIEVFWSAVAAPTSKSHSMPAGAGH